MCSSSSRTLDIKLKEDYLPVHPEHHFVRLDLSLPVRRNIKRNEINSEARYPCFDFLPFLCSAFYRGGGGGGRSDVEGLSNERGKIADTKSTGKKLMVGVDHPFAWLKLLFSANRCATHYSSNHNFCNFPASLPTGSILNRT